MMSSIITIQYIISYSNYSPTGNKDWAINFWRIYRHSFNFKGYIVSNYGKMIINYEMLWVWNNKVMAYFEVSEQSQSTALFFPAENQ
jgi:hypothetical protein